MISRVHARMATSGDASEVLRIAALMFEAIGATVDEQWFEAAGNHLGRRLGDDVAVFVVDDPDREGKLIAVAAGSVYRRLPVPGRLAGRAGYVQWVSTDHEHRRRGASRAVMEGLLAWFDQREVEVVELHATQPGEPLCRGLGFDSPAGPSLRRFREFSSAPG